MDKKFYEMPEVNVVDLQIEGTLLIASPGDGQPTPKDETPGGEDDF